MHMETFIFDVFVVWMMGSVALGVGASSLAITGFMVALYDGVIEPGERRILGVTYWALRWAMLMIPVTLSVVTYLDPGIIPHVHFIWIIIAVLYINAFLMTKHWMPIQVGPALQAASWYTLGFLLSIAMFDLHELTLTLFLSLYVIDTLFFLTVVNGYLLWQRRRAVK